jgi:tRNA (cmo5U34)-methyltransferase
VTEDKLFLDDKLGEQPFRFDAAVARVFPDMLKRSIPGYAASLEAIGSLAARFVRPGTRGYDLGCSLGGAAIAMRQGIRAPDCEIIAIDNAPAMIERCREIVAADDARRIGATPIVVRLGDLRDIDIERASMVVLNYTLQFIDPGERDDTIRRIHEGLVPGGILVLSEKVVDEDPEMQALLVDLYHEHKRRNDYSALEIARKRAALENVLRPETVTRHRERLTAAGFSAVAVWFRYFNFVSLIAIRR